MAAGNFREILKKREIFYESFTTMAKQGWAGNFRENLWKREILMKVSQQWQSEDGVVIYSTESVELTGSLGLVICLDGQYRARADKYVYVR